MVFLNLYKKLEDEGRMCWDKWWLADDYRYGQIPFKSALPPETLAGECLRARQRFYSVSSIFYRMFDRTNAGSFFMLQAFWIINWMLRKEASQRDGMPLGDASFEGDLLPVARCSAPCPEVAEHGAEHRATVAGIRS